MTIDPSAIHTSVQTNTGDLSHDTLALVRAASIETMGKRQKAEWLRSRNWRQINGGKTPQWRSPGGILASSASVAIRLQILADMADLEE
jgi:hypothetical protein